MLLKFSFLARNRPNGLEGVWRSFLTSTSTFVLTWAMSRYRLPVDAVLLIFAAVAMAKLLERANARALER